MPEQRYPELTDQAIEAARELIGTDLRRHPRWTEAGKEMIIRFALSIGSRNPLYISEELVSSNLFGTMLAHPSSLHCFDDTYVAPRLPGIQAIYGGADWEYYRPVLVHDKISARARLLNVEKKQGEFSGAMVLQTGEVLYTNQEGEEVAKATSYVMLDSPGRRARAGQVLRPYSVPLHSGRTGGHRQGLRGGGDQGRRSPLLGGHSGGGGASSYR